MSRPVVLNIVKDAVSLPVHTPAMKWLIRNKETGLYLKNLWTWTQSPVEAHVFPNGLSLVQFCLRHKVPPMDMIPLPETPQEAASV